MRCHDVVVVGGGLTGLVAAERLLRRGIDCELVEQCDRLGGRVETVRTTQGILVELGGGRIAGFHSAMQELCGEFGVALKQEANDSCATFDRVISGGKLLGPERREAIELGIERLVQTCLQAAEQPSIDERLRAIEVDEWLHGHGDGQEAIPWFSDLPQFCQSAWALVALVRGAPGRRFFTSLEAFRVPDGMSILIARLADSIGTARIRTGVHVRRIRLENDQVKLDVEGKIDGTMLARTVILAVPPAALDSIAGVPRAKGLLGRLSRNRQITAVVQSHASGNRPRSALSDEVFRTATLRDCQDARYRVLEISTLANDEDERQRPPPAELTRFAGECLGLPVESAIDIFERDWGNFLSAGGSYGAMPPGTVADERQQIVVFGPICIAGDMVIPRYCGFMEGAVRSGDAARNYAEGRL